MDITFDLGLIMSLMGALVGLPALWALVIDILKWAGVVTDGTSGKWSAAFNLLSLLVVAGLVQFAPDFDVIQADALLVDVAAFVGLVFGYVLQISASKGAHLLYTRKFGWRAFSHPTGD